MSRSCSPDLLIVQTRALINAEEAQDLMAWFDECVLHGSLVSVVWVSRNRSVIARRWVYIFVSIRADAGSVFKERGDERERVKLNRKAEEKSKK